jgi:hypothetical protein
MRLRKKLEVQILCNFERNLRLNANYLNFCFKIKQKRQYLTSISILKNCGTMDDQLSNLLSKITKLFTNKFICLKKNNIKIVL